jgi:hypothetical protein
MIALTTKSKATLTTEARPLLFAFSFQYLELWELEGSFGELLCWRQQEAIYGAISRLETHTTTVDSPCTIPCRRSAKNATGTNHGGRNWLNRGRLVGWLVAR